MADADGTYDLTKIPELCRPVLAGDLDVNLATRLEGASHETMPFLHRTVGTPVLTFLTTRASGRPLTKDSQTGYRAFRRDRMLELGLASNGMELASEMLIKAARADLHIGNVDIPYRARIGDSKLDTWSDGWRHLKLIFLLAPDILLVVPGLTLAAAGVLALILSFFQPSGVEIGSARWQPVFFSGIAIVLGLQMFCAGAIVTSSSPVAHRGRLSYNFLRDQLLPRRAIRGGLITVVLGFAIDTGLFFWWLFGTTSDPIIGVRFALASLAQTLMLLGGSLVVFGLVIRFARASNNEVLAARLDERTREPA
jgi:hypothetical protein